MSAKLWLAVSLVFAGATLVSTALNRPPVTPRITEPPDDGAVLSPADVHMETAPFSDPDGNAHRCTDWEIWTITPLERVRVTSCIGGLERVHTHLGDGMFENSHAGRFDLMPKTNYQLRVRHRDNSGDAATEWSAWSERFFSTEAALTGTTVPWTLRQWGYRLDVVGSDFQLPVNIAFVPHPGSTASSPYLYVTELYGAIKVVTRDFTVQDVRIGVTQLQPDRQLPGIGGTGRDGDRRRSRQR